MTSPDDVIKSGSKFMACCIYDMGLILQSFNHQLVTFRKLLRKCFIKGIFNPNFEHFKSDDVTMVRTP